MNEKELKSALKGTTLEIYRFMLKTSKPMGIRELQRTLNLSSPSVVQYHLYKLERLGLIKKEMGNYVIHKIFSEDCIIFGHSIFQSI